MNKVSFRHILTHLHFRTHVGPMGHMCTATQPNVLRTFVGAYRFLGWSDTFRIFANTPHWRMPMIRLGTIFPFSDDTTRKCLKGMGLRSRIHGGPQGRHVYGNECELPRV
ncbi:MAG: hypothetical protein K2M65_03600 [Muribaculaceae bacterium]|nr:hypothetical protein [Muribaculaceae bacterium]